MQASPVPNQLQRGLRRNVPDEHAPVEVELAVLTLVLCVEVRRLVLPVEHPDDDSEEDGDDRHAAEYIVVVVSEASRDFEPRCTRGQIRFRRAVDQRSNYLWSRPAGFLASIARRSDCVLRTAYPYGRES